MRWRPATGSGAGKASRSPWRKSSRPLRPAAARLAATRLRISVLYGRAERPRGTHDEIETFVLAQHVELAGAEVAELERENRPLRCATAARGPAPLVLRLGAAAGAAATASKPAARRSRKAAPGPASRRLLSRLACLARELEGCAARPGSPAVSGSSRAALPLAAAEGAAVSVWTQRSRRAARA